ncbi:MAG: OmpA family protein [Alphaproteobacteria bacterium]
MQQGVKIASAPAPAPAAPSPPKTVQVAAAPASAAPATSKAAPPAPPPVSAPPIPSSSGGTGSAISFAKDTTELPDSAKSELNGIADTVKKEQGTVHIVAYASGTADEASVARRVSLSRALAIRAFLMSKGVNSQSIVTQALGNQENADKAEVSIK